MICHAIIDHALSFLSQVVRMSSVRGQSYDAYIMHFLAGIRPFTQYITDVAVDKITGSGRLLACWAWERIVGAQI